jgi:hypothetical protein
MKLNATSTFAQVFWVKTVESKRKTRRSRDSTSTNLPISLKNMFHFAVFNAFTT